MSAFFDIIYKMLNAIMEEINAMGTIIVRLFQPQSIHHLKQMENYIFIKREIIRSNYNQSINRFIIESLNHNIWTSNATTIRGAMQHFVHRWEMCMWLKINLKQVCYCNNELWLFFNETETFTRICKYVYRIIKN
eukprot:149441_1